MFEFGGGYTKIHSNQQQNQSIMNPPGGQRRGTKRGGDPAKPSEAKKKFSKADVNKASTSAQDNDGTGFLYNTYDSLSDDDDGSMVSAGDLYLRRSQQQQNSKHPKQKVKYSSLPPIVVQGVTIQQLQTILKKEDDAIRSNVVLKIAADGIKLLAKDDNTFNHLQKMCKDNKLSGFTFTPKRDRLIKICLYSLWDMAISELEAELAACEVKPTQVKKMNLKNPRYTGEAIYILYYKRSQNVTVSTLRNITGLFNVVPRFQYYKNRSGEPTQCAVCQQLGHSSFNCFRTPVCVRCSESHSSDKCVHLPVDDDAEKKIPHDKLKCALCNENHTSTFRQCKVRVDYKQKRMSVNQNINKSNDIGNAQRKQQPQRQHGLTQPVQRPMYSSVVKYNNHNNIHSVNNGHSDSNARLDQLLSPSECLNIFEYFFTELIKCKSVDEQIRTIARLSFEQASKLLQKRHP